jgi:hypothetical protein
MDNWEMSIDNRCLVLPTYTEAHGRHDGLQSIRDDGVRHCGCGHEKAHHASRVISHYVLPQVVRQPAAQSVRHKKILCE